MTTPKAKWVGIYHWSKGVKDLICVYKGAGWECRGWTGAWIRMPGRSIVFKPQAIALSESFFGTLISYICPIIDVFLTASYYPQKPTARRDSKKPWEVVISIYADYCASKSAGGFVQPLRWSHRCSTGFKSEELASQGSTWNVLVIPSTPVEDV